MLWASLFSLGPHPTGHAITLNVYYLSSPIGEGMTVSCTNGHIFRITYQDCTLATGILPENITIIYSLAAASVKFCINLLFFFILLNAPLPFPVSLQDGLRLLWFQLEYMEKEITFPCPREVSEPVTPVRCGCFWTECVEIMKQNRKHQ